MHLSIVDVFVPVSTDVTAVTLHAAYLSLNGSIEPKAICDHHVDLPLAVLLSDALIGGEPRQGGLQSGKAVAGGQADVEHLTRLLRPQNTKGSWMLVQITDAQINGSKRRN